MCRVCVAHVHRVLHNSRAVSGYKLLLYDVVSRVAVCCPFRRRLRLAATFIQLRVRGSACQSAATAAYTSLTDEMCEKALNDYI